jgi:hypothetical protein
LTLVLTAALLGLYATRGLTLPLVARWLDVGETPGRADYVMVLTGDENTRLENQDPNVRNYDCEAIL